MRAVCEAMSIYLESMSKPWLHHTSTAFNFGQQSLQVNVKVFIDILDVHSKNCAKQNSAETWCGVHG
jgi:hypothetical protein